MLQEDAFLLKKIFRKPSNSLLIPKNISNVKQMKGAVLGGTKSCSSEPRQSEKTKHKVEIQARTIPDKKGILILLAPYANPATKASTHKEITKRKDSSITNTSLIFKLYTILWEKCQKVNLS